MLKFQHIQLDTNIRAYDFEPMPGRRDRFIEGNVIGTTIRNMAYFLVVKATVDSSFPADNNRVGEEVFVPMEMGMEFDEIDRVQIIK